MSLIIQRDDAKPHSAVTMAVFAVKSADTRLASLQFGPVFDIL